MVSRPGREHGNFFGVVPGEAAVAPGKVGKALALDGAAGWLEAAGSIDLEPEKLTVEAWISASSATACARDSRRLCRSRTAG